jgi:FlaA1/EpsC-like NDP-sugar epimerase
MMVKWMLQNCFGGETIIPMLKGASLVRIVKQFDPTRNIRVIGIRPGEKLHEQLLNRREHERTVMHENKVVCPYFVLLPDGKEWDVLYKKYLDMSYKLIDRKSYFSNDIDIQMSDKEIFDSIINVDVR